MDKHPYQEKGIRIESICNVEASDIIYTIHDIFMRAVTTEEDMMLYPTHHEIICPNRNVPSGELMEDLNYENQKISSLPAFKDLTQLSTVNRFESFSERSPSFVRTSEEKNFLFTGSWINDIVQYGSTLSEEDRLEAIDYLIKTNEKMLKIPTCDTTFILMQSEMVLIKEFLDMNPNLDFEDYLTSYRIKKNIIGHLIDNYGLKVISCDVDKKRLSNEQIAKDIITTVYGR